VNATAETAVLGRRARSPVTPVARVVATVAALAGMVVTSTIIAVNAASLHTPLVAGGKQLPGSIAGPLAGLGGHLSVAAFTVLFTIMCGCYAVVIALRGGGLDKRVLIGAIVLLHAIFLLGPPLLSTDVFNYLDYGRLGALHHLNPYLHGPGAAPQDPAFHFIPPVWRDVSSAYGPLFTFGTYGTALLGLSGGFWALKIVTALASLGCVWLVWKAAARLGRPALFAAVIVGLNPFVLAYAVGGAHNDVLMVFGLLAGVALAVAGRERLAAGAIVAATAIKLTAGLALPFLVFGARRARDVVIGAGVAAVGVGALALAGFGSHALSFLGVLEGQQKLTAPESFPLHVALLFGKSEVTANMRLVAHIALAIALLYLVIRCARGMDWLEATGWAMLALVVTTTWLLPWYTLWALPFAALARNRNLLWATFAVQALLLLHELPQMASPG
jgi:glycosyl transferase family 87